MEEGRPAPPQKPDLYVVARFLDRLARPHAHYTRSKLQTAVRLNYDLFRSYLEWLLNKGFVKVETTPEEKEIFLLTPAGLEAHKQLVGWIQKVLGDSLR